MKEHSKEIIAAADQKPGKIRMHDVVTLKKGQHQKFFSSMPLNLFAAPSNGDGEIEPGQLETIPEAGASPQIRSLQAILAQTQYEKVETIIQLQARLKKIEAFARDLGEML
jgi:hypothetical protein